MKKLQLQDSNRSETESYQVFKCRITQHKEIKFNLTRDLTLTFDGSLAPRAPNPNVHHTETSVYPNPNIHHEETNVYILIQTLTLTSIIHLYPNPNPNPNVQHEEISDGQNKFLYLSR